MERRYRVVVAECGLDGHDRGAAEAIASGVAELSTPGATMEAIASRLPAALDRRGSAPTP